MTSDVPSSCPNAASSAAAQPACSRATASRSTVSLPNRSYGSSGGGWLVISNIVLVLDPTKRASIEPGKEYHHPARCSRGGARCRDRRAHRRLQCGGVVCSNVLLRHDCNQEADMPTSVKQMMEAANAAIPRLT